MLVSKTVDIKWNSYTRNHYETKGYVFTKYKDLFEVSPHDVMTNSTARVCVECDYCGVTYDTEYRNYAKNKNNEYVTKDSCKTCFYKKQEEIHLLKYGVPYPMQRKEVARKTGDTLKTPFIKVKNDFEKAGYLLVSEASEFLNYQSKLKYMCQKHIELGAQISTYSSLKRGGCCKKCRAEKISDKLRMDFYQVRKEFETRGFTLLDEEYTNNSVPMKYICPYHPKSIHKICLANLKSGQGCPECFDERRKENPSNWNGGITSLRKHLREHLAQWKKDSMKLCDYKCVISGDSFDVIHHQFSFNKILDIVLEETGLSIRESIGDYTKQELTILENKSMEVHYRYPLGVCLREDIHRKYHNIYGFDNTPEQFQEFKNSYLSNNIA